MDMVRVRFTPSGAEAVVKKGTTVLEAARAAGIAMESPCGGQGSCRRCLVEVGSDFVPPVSAGEFYIIQGRFRYILACQTAVERDGEFHIPEEKSAIVTGRDVLPCLCHSGGEEPRRLSAENASYLMPEESGAAQLDGPLIENSDLVITPPSVEDNSSDWSRLTRAVKGICNAGEITASRELLSDLPGVLRDSGWKPRVYMHRKGESVGIVSVSTPESSHYCIALDIGTTTLAASLVDMGSGKVVSTKACYNPQLLHGEDVITRIIAAEKEEGRKLLHGAVVEGIEELIGTFLKERMCDRRDITAIFCAGNTTMIHLLLSIPPRSIRLAPYVPVFQAVPLMKAGDAGISLVPHALLFFFPAISSYVGGDITAGVLSSGMAGCDEISILMDMGTNGEVVLGCSEWLTTCSCSAGPAFEGGGITHGMRASAGALHSFEIAMPERTFRYETICDEKARGICGSGLIDIVAELLKAKYIDRSGRFDSGVSADLLREGESGAELVIVEGEKSSSGKDITISEADIANIVRSKGAIHAGMEFLLSKMGLNFMDVRSFYIAGGFGCALNIENGVRTGLLPDVPRDRFHFIGNSALQGAIMAVRSGRARTEADRIAGMMAGFELSEEHEFMNRYTAALFLPHTELDRFPSVTGS